MASREEVDRVIEFAREHGWEVSKTRSSHWKFVKPGRRTVYHSSTPSCPRAGKNAIAKLKRSERDGLQSASVQ